MHLLLRAGAAVDVRGDGGMTPLLVACRGALSDSVEVLLQYDCDINAQGSCGETALMTLARQSSKPSTSSVLRRLLLADADTTLVDCDGMAALDHARAQDKERMSTAYHILNEHLAPRGLTADTGSLTCERVRITGLVSRPDINETHGVVLFFSPTSGRYGVELSGDHGCLALRPANLELLDPFTTGLVGKKVVLTGLSRPDLNGCTGAVLSFSADRGRVQVAIGRGRDPILVKPANVQPVVSPVRAATPPAAPPTATHICDGVERDGVERAPAPPPPPQEVSALFTAAMNADASMVRELIAAHASIEDGAYTREHGTWSPLMAACQVGACDVARILLDARASHAASTEAGLTPLGSAIVNAAGSRAHFDLVTLLLDAKADIHFAAQPTDAFIASAVGDVREACLEMAGATPIHLALDMLGGKSVAPSEDECSRMLQLLIARGASVTENAPTHGTPVFKACAMQRFDLVRLLLGARASASQPHSNGTPPLCLAARAGDLETMRALLDGDANPDACDGAIQEQPTPLMWSAQNDFVDAVRLLLDHHADTNLASQNGSTALITTCAIMHRGPNEVPMRSVESFTIAKLLLGAGASVNHADSGGLAALHKACGAGGDDLPMVQLLLSHQADPNVGGRVHQTDRDDVAPHVGAVGVTPLLQAAGSGRVRLVEALLAAQADPTLRMRSSRQAGAGRTFEASPLSIALQSDHSEIVRVLVDSRPQLISEPVMGELPMTIAREVHAHRSLVHLQMASIHLMTLVGQVPLLPTLTVFYQVRGASVDGGATTGLTEDQIDALHSETVVEHGASCIICLADVSAGERTIRLECGHCFHKLCLSAWLRLNGTCPTCRAAPNGK
jgi:ankyrin repeat protein